MNQQDDISAFAAVDTGTIELERPNGEPLLNSSGLQMSVTVYGPGSKQHQKATAKRNRAILAHVRTGGKKMKDEDQRELDADFLADITSSFNNFTYKGLQGHEQFKAFYMDATVGCYSEQVNKGVNDWGNFTK
jgi:hypothetical protein